MRRTDNAITGPAIRKCFWCGKDDGIVLPKRIPADRKKWDSGPKFVITDYEPCKECKANMALGITCIEASTTPKGNEPPIQEGIYPTGRWVVIKPEAAKEIFHDVDLSRGKLFIEDAVFEHIFGSAMKEHAE